MEGNINMDIRIMDLQKETDNSVLSHFEQQMV